MESESVEKVVVGGPHNLDGKRIDPKNASKNSKIFCGGLKNETTDEDVRKYFEDNFGAIETFERFAWKFLGISWRKTVYDTLKSVQNDEVRFLYPKSVHGPYI